jgi:hypothetical protein
MRTSGSTTETNLTIASALVALFVVVVLAGGPSEFLLMVERTLRSAGEGITQLVSDARK